MPRKKSAPEQVEFAELEAEAPVLVEEEPAVEIEEPTAGALPVEEEPVSHVIPVEEEPAPAPLAEFTRQVVQVIEDQYTPPVKKKKRPMPQAREQFDLNQVVASGVIRSVWGKNNDVFARLALSLRGKLVETDDAFASYLTLRFADGMVGGQPISIQSGDVLKVQGYLVHREYQETLRKFLDEANAMSFLDYVAADDLPAWRLLTLERRNGLVNVRSMSQMDGNGRLAAHFGEAIREKSANRAQVEGIVARVWEYRHDEGVDLFARVAVYDEHTPVDSKRAGNFGRARRAAHYVTVRFANGRTSNGALIRLHQKMRLRVVGELRDKAQVVTLRDELLKLGSSEVAAMMQRVTDGGQLSEIKNHQESLHILASAAVVYS
jgi:hypothetical protein